MFVPFTLFHVDRHLKKLDIHSQYSVEQIGSDCTRIDLRASVFQKFSGGACPHTPLASAGFAKLTVNFHVTVYLGSSHNDCITESRKIFTALKIALLGIYTAALF